MSSESPQPAHSAVPPLRISYVPGVTPGKWVSRWTERRGREVQAVQAEQEQALEELRNGSADLVFIRIPEDGYERPGDLHAIPLYREQPVVAAPKDHPLAAFEEVEFADLAGENLMDAAELGTPATALEVVASGAGLFILPMSVARAHSRRDVLTRPVHGVEGTRIAVAWLQDTTDPDVEEFIGIVRGRTANSSRQPSAKGEPAGKTRGTSVSGDREGSKPSGGRKSGKPVRGKAPHSKPGKPGGKPARRRPGKGRG
ncbi:LysR family transcriptional regulator substrate-binding protein [Arthrobacter sp. BL-252-APC-1A]|uniref:substrate-binding domain-containing protein n=1 Tax=Arthrobacter sp. BL-252-APC-1A TaxID=2606622 RepID=UPI001310EB72|nr:substrate-binding domain-containing protein [Arthrobacter sp. BL-252-APC-1A]MSR99130.1 LysR family transcriptional regulator substrate-binding protein [Arthrobacter sp. BL-252-APC-1A]